MRKLRKRRPAPLARRPDGATRTKHVDLAGGDVGVGSWTGDPEATSRPAVPMSRRNTLREDGHEVWIERVRADYAYVVRDLKRMTSISVLLLTTLLAMWIILEVP